MKLPNMMEKMINEIKTLENEFNDSHQLERQIQPHEGENTGTEETVKSKAKLEKDRRVLAKLEEDRRVLFNYVYIILHKLPSKGWVVCLECLYNDYISMNRQTNNPFDRFFILKNIFLESQQNFFVILRDTFIQNPDACISYKFEGEKCIEEGRRAIMDMQRKQYNPRCNCATEKTRKKTQRSSAQKQFFISLHYLVLAQNFLSFCEEVLGCLIAENRLPVTSFFKYFPLFWTISILLK